MLRSLHSWMPPFDGWLELAVATACRREAPAVLLEEGDDLPNLHRSLMLQQRPDGFFGCQAKRAKRDAFAGPNFGDGYKNGYKVSPRAAQRVNKRV